MEKKIYMTPAVEVIEIAEAQGIMAASGEPQSMGFDSSVEITEGSVAAKGNFDVWDLDE